LFGASAAFSQEPPTFRTDDANPDLHWFLLKPGEFPAKGSAHCIGGELIALDRINRTGIIRLDRTDAQKRSAWDRPLDFTLLPYGMVRYHGAPAELRDIPLGTHLHKYYYAIDTVFKYRKIDPKSKKPLMPPQELRDEAFSRAFLLEDDFCHSQRLQRLWRIDSIDTEKGTMTTTGVGLKGDQPDAILHAVTNERSFRARRVSEGIWDAPSLTRRARKTPRAGQYLNLDRVCNFSKTLGKRRS